MPEATVSDITTCKHYVDTLPEYAKKKGEEIHKKIQQILYNKYWGEPEFKVIAILHLGEESLILRGRIDFFDMQNRRIIEIKPFRTPLHAELQLMIYYEMMVMNGYRVKPYLLKYHIRNGKLKMEITPMKPIYGILRENLNDIIDLVKIIEKGKKPRIKVISCAKCPYRNQCRPDYVWIRQGYNWKLLKYEVYKKLIIEL